ncbi:MAG TPA: CRTAC1 family protein [Thermoanaerobaculia bacterium]
MPTPSFSLPFAEKSEAMGIRFTHVNGATGKKWMPETMGGGVAVLDYDGDGKPDLLFVGGSPWPGDPKAAPGQSPSLVLYRNEGPDASGLPHFRDVTREAGLAGVASGALYGMGAAIGDYDNDGKDDVLVTALDHARLFHNLGGRFEEVTAKAGVGAPGWTTSAAWFDYDGDGLLDLYVCHYVGWSPAKDLFCTLDGKTKSYCTPERYPGTSSRLYRNLGKGRFEDVTQKAGVATTNQKALGVAPWDFDGDGRIDFLVANDTAPNNLFRNKGDGTFEDVGISTGVAVDEAGRSRGSMGVAWADTKNGKGAAVAIGNFSNELKSLYWTESGEVFLDESPASGVGPSSFLDLTFGLFFFDADLDGRMDLLLANGHVEPTVQEVQKEVAYRQRPMLYRNLGAGKFAALPAESAGDLGAPLVGRGAAYADLDGDGDLDVIIVQNGGPSRVFLNPTNAPARSVRLRLTGGSAGADAGRARGSNRDAIGARVTASIGGLRLTQQVTGGQSYLSSCEKTLTFGLGAAAKVDALEIRWPDGSAQTLRDVPGGSRLTVTENASP